MDVLVSAPEGGAFPRNLEPVRLGVPFAPGQCRSVDELALVDHSGTPRPWQGRVLDTWADGSIGWLLVDALVDHDGGTGLSVYRLERRPAPAPRSGPRVMVVEHDDVIEVDTGAAVFGIARRGANPFVSVRAGGADALDAGRTTLQLDTADGPMTLSFAGAEAEDGGPVRAIVRLTGVARSASRAVAVTLRLHAFAGLSALRVDCTLHNPAAASHPGGYWELGDPASVLLRDVSFHVVPAGAAGGGVFCSTEAGTPLTASGTELELFQASSGGENWASRNHVDRDGRVTLEFRGYRLTSAQGVRDGLRATPIVEWRSGHSRAVLSVPEFWQNFPKAIEASPGGMMFRLFPRQHGALHELQPGEQKTHTFYVAVAAESLEWTRSPLFARLRPEAYCASGAFPYVVPLAEEPDPRYAGLVQAAMDGDDSFDRKREFIDEFGWRNFGDIYADHERVFYKGPPPVHSHYNNQYDALAGLARQFVRSGDFRWWRHFCELGRHVGDIDIYRTDGDRGAYNHGLFWHTAHYADAGRSSHRSYPRAPGVGGGGLSSEHNYATGLVLFYFLTGEPVGRDAAVGLARWVINMDDGSQTVFRWLSHADTGLASSSNEPTHQGPGRGAGYSIAALLDGYRLTRESRFLDKAEQLIRRCVHPDDDVAARRLLDAERRWSYTIFLHVIGRYLDEKTGWGQLDGMYAYARRVLAVYADWMAANERPYLERRDQLEFPTETWVAQELWKSEVFVFAAKYAVAPDRRAVFLERSQYFFRYAVETLSGMPTRTLARPLVLLLSRGLMHGYAARRPDGLTAPEGPPLPPLAKPRPYVPQKVRAIRRAIALAGAAAVLLAAAVSWLLL